MSKVCFCMLAFNSDWVLSPVLDLVQQYGPVVIAEGPVKYWQDQGYTTSTDKTNAIIEAHRLDPSTDIQVIHGQWPEKDEMQRALESMIPDDTTHVWIVDADETYKRDALEGILCALDTCDAVSFKARSFWAGFRKWIGGFEAEYEVQRVMRWYPGATFETHRPPTVLSKDGKPFQDMLHIDSAMTSYGGLFMYHYSYVFPRQVKMKAQYYHDRDPNGTIPHWFENVYLPWASGARADLWGELYRLEQRHQGVHNWRPERRNATFTNWFEGRHPANIEAAIPQLQARFDAELAECLKEIRG